MRLLYLHAYQSLIFNKVVSRRIKEWGLKLVVGDLVFVDSHLANVNIEKGEILLDATDEIDDQPEKIEVDAEIPQEEVSVFKVRPLKLCAAMIFQIKISLPKTMVKPLTEDDVKSGKYSIFDVVLPLPGHDITYPNNEMNVWYQEFLALDDLSSAKLKQKLKYEYLNTNLQ
jgi:tRNA pseudouridine13 synthase